MSKNREQKHAKHLAEQQQHEQHRHREEAAHHDEHFVEAPKGTSRTRFLFNFLLVVFLLMIFSITGPLMSTLSGNGGGAEKEYISWTLPNGERRSLTGSEFIQEKRNFAALEGVYPYLGMQGIDPGDDESTARFLITEDLARWNGVAAPSDDLAEFILTIFGDEANYRGYIAQRRDQTTLTFEKLLSRALTVQRYTLLLASGASGASPVEAAELWQTQNQEYEFQYVQLKNEDFEEAARAELPGPEELQDWFDGLSPFQKSRFNTQPSWSADLTWFDTSSTGAMDALFETYPRPEDEDAEEMALNYYNSFSYVRFVKPEPEENESSEDGDSSEEGDDAATEEIGDKFLAFDDVKEICLREAPIYYSMADWLSHMQARTDAGEVVDMQTEAAGLGLTFVPVDPRTREAWGAGEEAWSGPSVAGSTGSLPEGRLATRVVVEENALVVARVIEKLAPTLPPFEEIREQAGDEWVKERRSVVAVEKLAALRAGFEVEPEEGTDEGAEESAVDDGPRDASAELEAFKAAVTAAGFTVVERDYRTRYPRPYDDPADLTDADTYLQGNTLYYSLEAGDIAEPEASRDGIWSYLVRFGGQRDADLSKMDPGELEQMMAQQRRTAEIGFFSSTFDDPEWIKRTFSLRLQSWENEEEGPTN